MKHSLKLVQLLERYGADLHKVSLNHHTNQFMNALSTAIDWGKPDVVDYLRSRGCKLPENYKFDDVPDEADSDIVRYFKEHFGPVRKQALIEIVPTEPPIAIHVVPPDEKRRCLTLFTSGMSGKAMKIPRGGDADYRYAELFIQLPGDWKYQEIGDPVWGWPIEWLRWLAQFPHQQRTWLGGPVTIAAREEPPQPIAPNLPFTSMLLLAERHYVAQRGGMFRAKNVKIQLYRLMPLYTEERDLEINQGIDALMRAFDKIEAPFIFDPSRPNAARIGVK